MMSFDVNLTNNDEDVLADFYEQYYDSESVCISLEANKETIDVKMNNIVIGNLSDVCDDFEIFLDDDMIHNIVISEFGYDNESNDYYLSIDCNID